MTAPPPTLPTGPLPHPALDYAALRAEGLALLGQLAGSQWTDFNTHDPGVTILEQLCYALTDLGYRGNFPVADLIASSGASDGPGPASALPGDPVTLTDLAAVVLDSAQSDRVFVGPVSETALPVYYHEASGEIRLAADPGAVDSAPLLVQGPLQIAVKANDDFAADEGLLRIEQRLHGARLLGSDFELRWLATVDCEINARIEVDEGHDPTALLAEIIERLEDCLAPPARFIAVADAIAQGRAIEQILEGPLTARGVLDALPEQPQLLMASDLIHAITDAAGVRAVREISPATLKIPAGLSARLKSTSSLTLLRNGLVLRVDVAEARRIADRSRLTRRNTRLAGQAAALTPAPGRQRRLSGAPSLQRQFPAAYGIGEAGLPASASAQRRAQARQLAAYLLIFDQLLANQLAQLAQAGNLLSADDDSRSSYFAESIVDPPLALAELVDVGDDAAAQAGWRDWLQAQLESDGLARRQRFLAHLLARVGEPAGNPFEVESQNLSGAASEAALLGRQREFLRRFPRLSGGRGSGRDLFAKTESALVERLRLKLGGALQFDLVEHVLLRPVAQDRLQLDADGQAPCPLFANVIAADPWSNRVSVVIHQPAAVDDVALTGLKSWLTQTLAAEMPAHLTTHLHWLDDAGEATWAAFQSAWAHFRQCLHDQRWPALAAPDAQVAQDGPLANWRFRDARDRLIDLLGIARCYPLRDLAWPPLTVVAPGQRARLSLAYSQPGVNYALCDESGQRIVDGERGAVAGTGTGAALVLETLPITVDLNFRLLATRRAPDAAAADACSVWLHAFARVQEGVDPALAVGITDWPLLDTSLDQPQATDARLADFGAPLNVEIEASQEGVAYSLHDLAAGDDAPALSASVVGTSGKIVLTLVRAVEDIDLRVRGVKNVGSAASPEWRKAWLNTVLALRVRADPAVAAQLAVTVVDHGAAASLQIGASSTRVRYQAWRRDLADTDFIFNDAGDSLDLVVDGGRVVRLAAQKPALGWVAAPGWTTCGQTQAGAADPIHIELGGFEADTGLRVQAIKSHRVGSAAQGSDRTLDSSVQLARRLALLVRPDTEVALRIEVDLAASPGPWLVSGGRAGTFYELRQGDQAIALPAYFHQRNAADSSVNKGINRLRVEVDLALAREPAAPTDPARAAPPDPLLDTLLAPALTLPAAVQVRARKAMSGLVADLRRSAVVDALPQITAPAAVQAGDSAVFVVVASRVDERYSLVAADATVVAGPLVGTGKDLILASAALTQASAFVVSAERLAATAASAGLVVVRRSAAMLVKLNPA